MGFGGDRRGQSVQIGAVLLFGVLVLSLTTFQATVVPQENEEIEFNHNQRVQTDMLQLRGAVLGAASTGTTQPVTIEMGTRYPARTFLINPGPASGSLRTVDLGGGNRISVRNAASVDSETTEYWNGAPRDYDTKGLAYKPNYNEFDSAPATVYENSVVYNRAPPEAGGGVVARSEQTVVDGRTISLVALQGEADSAAVEPVSVGPQADSAPARTVAVQRESAGNPVVIEVPTELSQAIWEQLLADQRQSNGGYVTSISVSGNTLEIRLQETDASGDPVTYDLRLAGVSVGSGSVSTTATYVTDVSGDDTSVPEDGSRKLVVEVRDQYNNPVSGVTVSVTGSPTEGSVTDISPTTDEDGEAVFRYDAPVDVNTGTDVDVRLGFDGPDGDSTAGSIPEEEAVFDVTVMNSDGSTPTGAPPIINSLSTSNPSSGELQVDWTVNDSDGNLDQVEVVVEDSSDNTVDTRTVSVSGSSDSGTVAFTGLSTDTYDVTLNVIDTSGNSASQTKSQSVSGSAGDPPSASITSTSASNTNGNKYDVTVGWEASDTDGDLASGTITVSDSNRGTTKTVNISPSGSNDSGSETVNIKLTGNPSQRQYDVTLSVEDSTGNSDTDTDNNNKI
jgi:hypothetical protein